MAPKSPALLGKATHKGKPQRPSPSLFAAWLKDHSADMISINQTSQNITILHHQIPVETLCAPDLGLCGLYRGQVLLYWPRIGARFPMAVDGQGGPTAGKGEGAELGTIGRQDRPAFGKEHAESDDRRAARGVPCHTWL